MINSYLYGVTIPAYDFGSGPDIPPLTPDIQIDPKSLFVPNPYEKPIINEQLLLDENDPISNVIGRRLKYETRNWLNKLQKLRDQNKYTYQPMLSEADIDDQITNDVLNQYRLYVKQNAQDNMYTIRKGDTLYKLAKQYGMSVSDLARLNGIKNSNKIKIGQKLNLPTRTKTPAVSYLANPTQYRVMRNANGQYAFM